MEGCCSKPYIVKNECCLVFTLLCVGGGAAEWIAYLQFTKKTELKKLNKNK
jgi:hypothetical protein